MMVNRMDGVDCLTMERRAEFQRRCAPFPVPSKQAMAEWYAEAFASKDNDYDPPPVPDHGEEDAAVVENVVMTEVETTGETEETEEEEGGSSSVAQSVSA